MSNTTTLVVGSALVGAVILVLSFSFRSSSKETEVESKSSAKRRYIGKVTVDEVARHCTEEDAWIIVDGRVYDVTEYVAIHPGGDAILRNVGADSSAGFHGNDRAPP